MALEKFKRLKVGALFMEQGTGKTRVAVELVHSTDAEFVLFLCPFSTKSNLLREIKKWELRLPFEIIAYESISASDRIYMELLERIRYKKLFIVADESIFIKNEEAKRFTRIMTIAKLSEYRLILNGTPITKSEWDLYNQMEFLSPKIIGMGRNEFLNAFFTKVQYKKKFERPKEFYKLSQVNSGYLKKLIEPYIFRVSFQFEKNIHTEFRGIPTSSETLEALGRLKKKVLDQIANDEPFLDSLTLMQYVLFTDSERCERIASELSGQIIVYCSYLEEIRQLAEKCDCYTITGETKACERYEIIEEFKNGNKPLLMTYGVGSYGLNLQFCNRIAFSSLTFDYAKVEQAQARIKRIGQEKDVTYTYFTSEQGIYSLVEKNLLNKRNLSELMIDEIKEMI